MVELSVGDVSGLIAAGVFVLQSLVAIIFPAALIGFVGDENTAVTWSVLGRTLQSSPWPTLLQTDAAARHGVRRRVSNGVWLQTAIVLLISVAAIVTPLGLHQVVEPGDNELVAFQFAQDDSPFGYGTPPRLASPFTRSCGDEVCPGSWKNQTCVQQGLLRNCSGVVYGRALPGVWENEFRKGASQLGGSVSSIFDMEWRVQVNASDAFGELGWYLKSGYRQIDILVLDPAIHLVDGLIVDALNGGIGFRNHTVPAPAYQHGSTWTEDILFIEPDVQCVDLNVTFDFHLFQNLDTSRLTVRDLALTDRGGFSALSRTSPDLSIPKHGNGQGPLNLRERAYKAAWANNFLTLAFFNATDPDETNITRLDVSPGMQFLSNSTAVGVNSTRRTTNFIIDYQAIRSTLEYGEYLDLPAMPSSRNASESAGNPFNISKEDFYRISEICAGGDLSTPANINGSIVGCGLVYGAARRTDGGSELSPQPGSHWSVPVYSCAASLHATIRTVAFRHNGTGLPALRVISAVPKSYPSPDDMPLWAVEDMRSTRLATAQPLWGALAPDSALLTSPPSSSSSPPPTPGNVSTLRSPTLRLPGLLTSAWTPLLAGVEYHPTRQGQNLPGVDFYVHALQGALSISRPGAPMYQGHADYSGATSLALYRKWRSLLDGDGDGDGEGESGSGYGRGRGRGGAEGAAEMVRLVWTDVAANSVVGTRGWGAGRDGWETAGLRKRDESSASAGASSGQDRVSVTVYRQRVRYRMAYMAPAILVLVLAAGVLGTWTVLAVMGRTGAAKMRRLLDATSPGRILGGFLWPSEAVVLKGTNEWVQKVGKKVVAIGERAGEAVAVAVGDSDRDAEMVAEESVQVVGKDGSQGTSQGSK